MDENFEKWIAQWAAAEKELAAEARKISEPEPPLRTSFYTGTPASQDYEESDEGQSDDWGAIWQRAMQMDGENQENLLTDSTDSSVNVAYAGSEGYGKQYIPTVNEKGGGKKAYTNNPINFASAGNDAEGDDGHVRVTKNWSNGDDLLELADVKRRVEEMERKFHDSDVLKKKDRSKLESELNNLRDRVKKLSERLTSNPRDDLT